MAASSQDYFTKVGNTGTGTTLAAPGHTIAGTGITVGSTTNWPTDTGVVFAVDTVTIVNGEKVRDVGSYTEWEGVVTGATGIGSLVLRYGTDQNYPAGSTTRVYIPVASAKMNRQVDGILVEHTQAGRHNMTSPKVTTSINDSNDNELLKVTATASAVNELTLANAATGSAPSLSATGSDSNIDIRLSPKGTGNVKRGASGGSIDWWEELGRTTLGSAGDTITISPISARKYLRIFISILDTGGAVGPNLRFNNDSANNYAFRYSDNFGAAASTASS